MPSVFKYIFKEEPRLQWWIYAKKQTACANKQDIQLNKTFIKIELSFLF